MTQLDVFLQYQKDEVGTQYRNAPGRCEPSSPFHDCSGLPSAAMVVAKAKPAGFCLNTDTWADLLVANPDCIAPLAVVRITPGMLAIRRIGHPQFADNGHMVTSLGIINGVARTVEARSTASGVVFGYFDGNRGFEIGGRPPGLDGFGVSSGPMAIDKGVGMEWLVEVHPSGDGSYWNCDATGRVYAYPPADAGRARYHGGAGWSPAPGKPRVKISADVVAFRCTPSGDGYWLTDRFGHVYAFGDAEYFGGQGWVPRPGARPVTLNGTCTGFVPTHSGRGYWMISSVGSLYAFGDAEYHGDPHGDPHT